MVDDRPSLASLVEELRRLAAPTIEDRPMDADIETLAQRISTDGFPGGGVMETEKRPSYEVTLKVPFYDLDPMQIVWHGNYLKYFDIARSELYDHLGVDLFAFHDRTRYIFPIIRTSVKHIHPLKRGDEFICRATVKEARTKIVVALRDQAGQGREGLRPGIDGTGRRPGAGDGDGLLDPGRDQPGPGVLKWSALSHRP